MVNRTTNKVFRVLFIPAIYILVTYSSGFGENHTWNAFITNPDQNTYEECSKEIEKSLSGKHEKFASPVYIALMRSYIGKVLNLVENGNKYAAHLTLQFYPLFWGNPEMHEFIDISLGKLIKENPELFLEIIKKYYNVSIKDFYQLNSILGNYGEEFVDNFEKKLKETVERIVVLKQVKNKALIDVRNKCIRLLTERKEFLEKNLKWCLMFRPVSGRDREYRRVMK